MHDAVRIDLSEHQEHLLLIEYAVWIVGRFKGQTSLDGVDSNQAS